MEKRISIPEQVFLVRLVEIQIIAQVATGVCDEVNDGMMQLHQEELDGLGNVPCKV